MDSVVSEGRSGTSTLTATGIGESAARPGDGGVEAAVGEHRGVDAAHQLAQLHQGLLGLGMGMVDEVAGALGIGGELGLGAAELHGHRDQALLGAVVEVALDPEALGLGGAHHPGPAVLELGDPDGERPGTGAEQGTRQGGLHGGETADDERSHQ